MTHYQEKYIQYKKDCVEILIRWGIKYPIFRFNRENKLFEIYCPVLGEHKFRLKIRNELKVLPWNDGKSVTIVIHYNRQEYDILKAEKDARRKDSIKGV